MEIGQQLSWLGAALRTSRGQYGPVYSTPFINRILHKRESSFQPRFQPPLADIICKIAFKTEEIGKPPNPINGQCWHDIFKNPVIVRGYPIPQRPEWGTGLEIPLNVMAGLAGSQRLDRFKDKLYIKGVSTMLVPTKQNGDVICWHMIYNKDGSRISYLDDNVDQEQQISRVDLENSRHVLGWCSEARFYAGETISCKHLIKKLLLTGSI